MPQRAMHYRVEPVEMRQLETLLDELRRTIRHLPTHCPVGRGGAQPLCALRRQDTSDRDLYYVYERLATSLARIKLSAVREETETPDTPPYR